MDDKNLNYASPNSSCYDNNANNCTTYGRLYNWNTAQTVAPPGWHIPSQAEWFTLINYLGGESIAGGKMKSTTGWLAPNEGATNSSGFSGIPSGAYYVNPPEFSELGERVYWWSSTHVGNGHAFNVNLDTGWYDADPDEDDVTNMFSIRCIRD